MSGERILVLDEEAQRRRINTFGLRCAGFNVVEASDVRSAHTHIVRQYPHLLLIIAALLDFWIQDFVRTLREDELTRDLPVVTLVEREGAIDAVSALACGISDVLREPVSPENFVTRVRACLDASSSRPRRGPLADLSLDRDRNVISVGNASAALGPTEQRLLEFFLAHPGKLIPRDLLLFRLWGGATNLRSRVLDVSVCRLRRALAQVGCEDVLHTVSRQGYRLSETPFDPSSGVSK